MSEPRYTLTLDKLYVLDSWDCYREVSRPRRIFNGMGGWVIKAGERRRARTLCARFNREHEEWLGRVA